jgi:hypothetical protein
MKNFKKIQKLIIAMMMIVCLIPATVAQAVPSKSGIDKKLSVKWTKKTQTTQYYKGKKKTYLDGLMKKWATGKISEKTLRKKVIGMKWSEASFVADDHGGYPTINYVIGSWGTIISHFVCPASMSWKNMVGIGIEKGLCYNHYSDVVAYYNSKTKTYSIYYLGIDFS